MNSFEDLLLSPSPPAWTPDAPSLALAEVIGASLDLTETLRATADALRGATGADRTLIYLYDPVHDTLRQVVNTAQLLNSDEFVSLRGRSVGEIPLWFSVRDSANGVLELPDTVGLRALTPKRARTIGMAGVLGLALRHPSVVRADDAPLGIAFCTWDAPQQTFDAQVVRVARSVAAQAAVAIANAINHAQGDDLVRRLSTLAEWAARLAAAVTPEQVTGRATRAAHVLLDAPLVAHWSQGRTTWYPASPDLTIDHAASLAELAGGGDRFAPWASKDLPGTLSPALTERALPHAAVCLAADRSSLLLVGRARNVTRVDQQIASLLADLTSSALRTSEAHAKVAHLALTDPLTEVGNRRAFEARLAEGVALAVRSTTPMSLCLIDLDHFRSFNEAGGHQAGDEALRLVANALRAEMRTSDQAFRIGGDEFALVLSDTPAASAAALLDRVRTALAQTPLGPLSITAGIAEAPTQGVDVTRLYAAADEALYVGKRAGRGRVITTR